jgi:hypothetical protein
MDNIGLENEIASIELLTGYPPKPILEMENDLGSIFGDSKQELLIVKEL